MLTILSAFAGSSVVAKATITVTILHRERSGKSWIDISNSYIYVLGWSSCSLPFLCLNYLPDFCTDNCGYAMSEFEFLDNREQGISSGRGVNFPERSFRVDYVCSSMLSTYNCKSWSSTKARENLSVMVRAVGWKCFEYTQNRTVLMSDAENPAMRHVTRPGNKK